MNNPDFNITEYNNIKNYMGGHENVLSVKQ